MTDFSQALAAPVTKNTRVFPGGNMKQFWNNAPKNHKAFYIVCAVGIIICLCVLCWTVDKTYEIYIDCIVLMSC